MKTTKQMIEVMTAYDEGKKIKCFNKYGVEVCTYDKSKGEEPAWDWLDYDYQIKEEPKYRPYVDTEEMINDFCERSGAKRSKMGEPFIWVKDGERRNLIISFEKTQYILSTIALGLCKNFLIHSLIVMEHQSVKRNKEKIK